MHTRLKRPTRGAAHDVSTPTTLTSNKGRIRVGMPTIRRRIVTAPYMTIERTCSGCDLSSMSTHASKPFLHVGDDWPRRRRASRRSAARRERALSAGDAHDAIRNNPVNRATHRAVHRPGKPVASKRVRDAVSRSGRSPHDHPRAMSRLCRLILNALHSEFVNRSMHQIQRCSANEGTLGFQIKKRESAL